MFDYTVETPKTVDEAIAALERTLSDHQFGVLWKLDIPTKLMEKGIALQQDFRVLEVCNPDIAKKVLIRNQKGGYFLPCKIVVYRSEETLKTHIGLLRPTSLLAMTEDEDLKEIAAEVEKTMIQAIDEAK
ncbi:hypothetical protein GCM10007416_17840 [Kroppenstedtia guangzhouensis]|jgi:uncharacterized protein (DUF302 family)|uniref:DUF302 domain-containing protein n=1 Tax=Kroppenstedtia guangzhouensis TaxID=1274356 RepID=A0ABQ1GJK3_9BACL|nr:DUF302 domain-containing protein [Kroppenstedtia guangzhouensis]GGA45160.1 hypothetical protein GCM10007416_17840 [Kroppenstedtia guangzhouensis]